MVLRAHSLDLRLVRRMDISRWFLPQRLWSVLAVRAGNRWDDLLSTQLQAGLNRGRGDTTTPKYGRTTSSPNGSGGCPGLVERMRFATSVAKISRDSPAVRWMGGLRSAGAPQSQMRRAGE